MKIVFVTNDHICLTHSLDDCRRDVFWATWSDACNDNLFHTAAKIVIISIRSKRLKRLLLELHFESDGEHSAWMIESIFAR